MPILPPSNQASQQAELLSAYEAFPHETRQAIDCIMDILLESMEDMGFRITQLEPVDHLKAAIVKYVLDTEQLLTDVIKT